MRQNLTKRKVSIAKLLSEWLLPVLILVSLFLLFVYSGTAVNYMKKGLLLCATALIPSLFPFMIISELIIKSGIGQKLSRLFRLPMRLLFGVSGSASSALILGALCGFPIGTLTLVKMLDKSEIDKRELERIMTFCNVPGAAFIISTLGASLLGNIKLGILIYASILISSVIIGITCRFIYKKDRPRSQAVCSVKARITATDFTDSVRSSTLSILNVCAYVLFFSTLVGCIGSTITKFNLPEAMLSAIFGIFEMSSGVASASALPNREHAVIMSAFIAGWSGISVHFQLISVASGRNISFKPYLIAKIFQGTLSALITFLAIKIFPDLLKSYSTVFLPQLDKEIGVYTSLSLALFLACALFLSFNWIKKRKIQNIIKKN